MRIALGSDHRGGKVARKLLEDVFLRKHYDGNDDEKDESMPGAYFISNAACSDDVDEQTGSEPCEVETLVYSRQAERADEQSQSANCFDYPDVAAAVAEAVASGKAERGILICGTGIGMCVAANKFQGIRAAVCYNEVAAELSRRHNDANVLCISGEYLGVNAIESLVRVWLTTPYDGGRHQKRIEKISIIEQELRA